MFITDNYLIISYNNYNYATTHLPMWGLNKSGVSCPNSQSLSQPVINGHSLVLCERPSIIVNTRLSVQSIYTLRIPFPHNVYTLIIPFSQKVYTSTFFKWIICYENDKNGSMSLLVIHISTEILF